MSPVPLLLLAGCVAVPAAVFLVGTYFSKAKVAPPPVDPALAALEAEMKALEDVDADAAQDVDFLGQEIDMDLEGLEGLDIDDDELELDEGELAELEEELAALAGDEANDDLPPAQHNSSTEADPAPQQAADAPVSGPGAESRVAVPA